MKSIQQGLATIYSKDQVQQMLGNIEGLIENYRSKTAKKDPFKLSEKDVVLITYGDQVHKEGETKLATLKKLLNEQLADTITIVHILPFYPSSSDDGFSVIDYKKVDPDLGTWNDIESLSEDYTLLFDAVINHNSSRSVWFEKYLANDPEYKDYYIETDRIKGFENVIRPRTSPLFHTFNAVDGKRNVWTTFSKDQVDLNFANPKVFIEILDLLLFYISEGAKIIRLDAVGFMWKQRNTNCLHLPQTHQLIKLMRKVIKKVDDAVLLLTETNVSHEENISYFGDGDEADMVYNFTLPPLLAYSLLSQNAVKLTAWAKGLKVPFPRVCFFNFLASHDGIGVRPVADILSENELDILIKNAKINGGKISYKSNSNGTKTPYEVNCNYLSLLKGDSSDIEIGIKRSILAHAVLLSMPGLPAIYFHSVFGSENDLEGMKSSGINRRINREKPKIDVINQSIENPAGAGFKILNALKKLIRIRKNENAFDPYASFKIDSPATGVFNIVRMSMDNNHQIYTLFNFTLAQKQISLDPDSKFEDLLMPGTYSGKIILKPLEFKWLKTIA